MAKSEVFNTGDFRIDINKEHLFLSVTPACKHGPGIKRDGVTSPRMKDPHSIPEVTWDSLGQTPNEIFDLPIDQNLNLKDTTNAFEQRAGTWTIYHHLNEFYQAKQDQWLIIGAQSCGDLTMNPWHVAYIGNSYLENLQHTVCGMLTDDSYQEPIQNRVYRCLVKWNEEAAKKLDCQYEFLDLKFISLGKQKVIQIYDSKIARNYGEKLGTVDDDRDLKNISPNIAPLIEFAFSGKTIIKKDRQIPLSMASDKFQDVRHIFSIPYQVKCLGYFKEQEITTINLGEYQLYGDLNARRAALCGPIIIDTDLSQSGGFFHIDLEELKKDLNSQNFKLVDESPRTVGEYCIHNDHKTVEIYFPKNVYPFGVLGMHENEIIGLSSSGLSGRIGNTLEGITRIMIDGFSCQEAIVLDEGLDVFQIINPVTNETDSGFQYTNEELLDKVLAFTYEQMQEDILKSKQDPINATQLGGNLKDWPLNQNLLKIVEDKWSEKGLDGLDYSDIFNVKPGRSQMRSVIIFAVKK